MSYQISGLKLNKFFMLLDVEEEEIFEVIFIILYTCFLFFSFWAEKLWNVRFLLWTRLHPYPCHLDRLTRLGAFLCLLPQKALDYNFHSHREKCPCPSQGLPSTSIPTHSHIHEGFPILISHPTKKPKVLIFLMMRNTRKSYYCRVFILVPRSS